jgi:pyruvate kinase
MSNALGDSLAKTRTRYIATLGPASSNIEAMEKLILAGVTMFRNNFAHAQYDEYRGRVQMLKDLNAKLGTNVLMQADIQGTNIRVGMLPPEGKVELIEGHSYVCVTNGGELGDGEIPINDDHLHTEVKVGEPFTFADGAIEGTITAVDGHRITVEVINSGILKQRKSINVPETELNRSCITDKDKKDLDFLINDAGVDWLALSFVANAAEIEEVRQLIGDKPIKIMSKIERKKAIDNMYEIVKASDAVMIARGDLGIEVPMEEVPIISKQMIAMAHQLETPVVTATQMMLSMVHSTRPTRAEVSDVANAIFDRSDAVMLSEETAEGAHPDLALATMVKIARRVEDYMYGRPNFFQQFEK